MCHRRSAQRGSALAGGRDEPLVGPEHGRDDSPPDDRRERGRQRDAREPEPEPTEHPEADYDGKAAKQLVDAGYRVELREYEGAVHDFSAQMKADFSRIVKSVLR